MCDIQAILLKGRSIPPFRMFWLLAGWNADVMVGAEAAIQTIRGRPHVKTDRVLR